MQFDANGRTLLPQSLRDYAGLQKKLVLVGQGNKLELWSEALWLAEREQAELKEKFLTPISDLDLSVRAANCMEVEGIETIGDLVRMPEEKLLEVRNFGKTSLKEITKKLGERGLSLGMDVASVLGEG